MNDYFTATIGQLIERARILRTKIPRDLPRDYDTLAQTCQERLKEYLERLRSLLDDPMFLLPRYQPERLRMFKRIVGDLDIIETVGITALDRAKDADHKLNLLLERITKEIRYPLVTPVVTTLSQQYFCIVTDLNLLCVPLVEGHFLLHLPDLYHELAHPLLVELDDPLVEPFQEAHFDALKLVLDYLADEKVKEDRRRRPRTTKLYSLPLGGVMGEVLDGRVFLRPLRGVRIGAGLRVEPPSPVREAWRQPV